jgi:hypothetical protein
VIGVLNKSNILFKYTSVGFFISLREQFPKYPKRIRRADGMAKKRYSYNVILLQVKSTYENSKEHLFKPITGIRRGIDGIGRIRRLAGTWGNGTYSYCPISLFKHEIYHIEVDK